MGTAPSFPESQFSASCSCAQIEDHHSIVLENAAIFRAQMMVKCLVVLQPPECRPNESNESRFRVAQSLKFANRRRIIGRWPEVVPILLDKRDCAAITAKRIAREVLVHKNKCFLRRNQRFKVLLTEPKPMVPQFRSGDGLSDDDGCHPVGEFRQ